MLPYHLVISVHVGIFPGASTCQRIERIVGDEERHLRFHLHAIHLPCVISSSSAAAPQHQRAAASTALLHSYLHPEDLSYSPAQPITTGLTCQISFAYSSIVRSEENPPEFAMLTAELLSQ